MTLLGFSAAFVGLVHSLAPGHWLPVVLMAKSRKWPLRTAIAGALMVALGHILLSVFLGLASIWVGAHFCGEYENVIEKYSGLALALFGLGYAVMAFFRHAECHGHTHHGPDPRGKTAPFLFLFSLGFSPCVAALPVFIAASTEGFVATVFSLVSFSVGVLVSLVGATVLAALGMLKLDHPLFEHYGDVLTGGGVALMGFLLFFFPQMSWVH